MRALAGTARIRAERELGKATCICETCRTLVPARIVASETEVWYEKTCTVHGLHRSVVSTDPEYFVECLSRRAALLSSPDNGLTPGRAFSPASGAHQGLRPTAMAILEIVEGCDAKCPTCSAASTQEIVRAMPLEEISAALDAFVSASPQHDLLMISGGEPALHPQVIEALGMAHARGIARVMLITNGFRIADDPAFAPALAGLGPWLEVYLQFDSFSEHVLRVLRGEDVRDIRARALRQLERHGIATTLVCVVKKGLNDTEIGGVVETALTYKCVRGVTYQPMREVGRTDGFVPETEWLTLADVRTALISSGRFDAASLQPHPCNPETICIGYLSRASGACITDEVMKLTAAADAIRSGAAPSIRDAMFFSPAFETSGFSCDDVFRVSIVTYMDRFDFTAEGAARSCIHFLEADGSLDPLETHYLFPRPAMPKTSQGRTVVHFIRSGR